MTRDSIDCAAAGIRDHRARCLQGFRTDEPASLAVLEFSRMPNVLVEWIAPLVQWSLAAAGGSNSHVGDLYFQRQWPHCHCAWCRRQFLTNVSAVSAPFARLCMCAGAGACAVAVWMLLQCGLAKTASFSRVTAKWHHGMNLLQASLLPDSHGGLGTHDVEVERRRAAELAYKNLQGLKLDAGKGVKQTEEHTFQDLLRYQLARGDGITGLRPSTRQRLEALQVERVFTIVLLLLKCILSIMFPMCSSSFIE